MDSEAGLRAMMDLDQAALTARFDAQDHLLRPLADSGESFGSAYMSRIYPSCAENPAVQGGDVERGERSSPKLNSVSAAARCTGG